MRQYLEAGLIDSLHLALSPVLLGQGEAAVRRSRPACVGVLRNRTQGFGIRDPSRARESVEPGMWPESPEEHASIYGDGNV